MHSISKQSSQFDSNNILDKRELIVSIPTSKIGLDYGYESVTVDESNDKVAHPIGIKNLVSKKKKKSRNLDDLLDMEESLLAVQADRMITSEISMTHLKDDEPELAAESKVEREPWYMTNLIFIPTALWLVMIIGHVIWSYFSRYRNVVLYSGFLAGAVIVPFFWFRRFIDKRRERRGRLRLNFGKQIGLALGTILLVALIGLIHFVLSFSISF